VRKYKVLLLAINQTALSSMVYLYEKAEKLGFVCKIIVEPGVLYNGTGKVERLGVSTERNSKSLLSILPYFIKKPLRLARDAVVASFDLNNKMAIKKWINIQNKRELTIKAFLRKENPDFVYVYGDRHGGHEPALIKISQELNIPVIIPPIAFPSEKDHLLIVRRNKRLKNRSFIVTNNVIFKNKFPLQWIHDEVTCEDFSYYPSWEVESRKRCGVLPDNPWTLGGGDSNIICTDGDKSKGRLISNGVKPGKIKITGHPEHDLLYNVFYNIRENKSKIYNKYLLNLDLPILLIALPQTWEHNILPEKEHWVLQEALCEAAALSNWNILLSLHPKMKLNHYKYLEEKFGFRIVNERLGLILPLADIYLVGQGSSTVLWAVLSEVPTIIADWYGLNYTHYDWIDGKVVIKKQADLKPTILEFVKSTTLRKTFKKYHIKQKHLVSPFDGHCVDRIFSVVE